MSEINELKVNALEWTGQVLRVLDQRLLPDSIVFNEYNNALNVAQAIQNMEVRGAPAIGIAAAYGVALSIMQHYSADRDDWLECVQADIRQLAASRPTAVNLFWALQQMQDLLTQSQAYDDQFNSEEVVGQVVRLAEKIHADDIQANQVMGRLGVELLNDNSVVMTHCNAGALATGGYGTALGVIRSACRAGKIDAVYAGETRPWLQGARLTVWELAQDGIASTLIADSAAAWLMQSGKLDWVIVGADRIAANGDVANKVGTYSLAVLARQHGVKVMVVAPLSTIDFSIASGQDIEIEQRQSSELLTECYQSEESLVSAWNPVFDVTPASFVTAIVTERGVVLEPEKNGVRSLQ